MARVAPTREGPQRRARGALGALAVLVALGCDPTAGLLDTKDAALPDAKRYFDGAGQQALEGPWSRVVVDLDFDTLYHLGARRLDDEEPTFHLFGPDTRDGCSVSPNVGTWLMPKANAAPTRLLPYLESADQSGRGRLRFTTVDCEVQDITLDDAGRPYARLYDDGFLVPTKRGYTFVDPWQGESHEIAEELQRALLWNELNVVFWADGKLKRFSPDFQPGAEAGEGVLAALMVSGNILFETEAGLQRANVPADSLELETEEALKGACRMQLSPLYPGGKQGVWLALEQPCGSEHGSVVKLDTTTLEVLEQREIPFPVDTRRARALLSFREDPLEPVGLAYLTDVGEDGRGTLWAWRFDAEEPVRLGEHANLDSIYLDPPAQDWDGTFESNFRSVGGYLVYDWLRFRWDGSSEPIGESVVRNASTGELLVNFDGVAGDLTRFDEEGTIVAEDVPPSQGTATSYTKPRRFARIDGYDGSAGRLLLSNDSPNPQDWDTLGSAVAPDSLRFSWFMPALLFLEQWDPETETGKLVAYNYELDARAELAEGVSSFDLTSYPWDGVVYSVPFGKQRGIWFSRAK